jgi:hypothetical protein
MLQVRFNPDDIQFKTMKTMDYASRLAMMPDYLLPGKEVVYVLPITSILGRLPVVRAGDTGTIPFSYRDGCRNGAHRYDHDLANADSRPGAGDGCPMYFVNSWALGWSRDP